MLAPIDTLAGIALGLIGIALVLLVFLDFIHTTLRLEGAGPLTRAVNSAVWRSALFLGRRLPRRASLSNAGVLALLANIATWLALLWLGWLLVFLSHPAAVVSSHEAASADFWSRVYFTGYSVITLGVGDYAPSGAPFQVATVVAAVTGFFLMTLSVTYLVPVVSAVVGARQLAASVFLLGATPASQIANAGSGGVSREFRRSATSLAGPVVLLSQRYFAYPVLRYFPSSRREYSTAIALAVLDEALTLLLHGVERSGRDADESFTLIRNALEIHLHNQAPRLPAAERTPPPIPSLESLRAAGLPTVSDDAFRRSVAQLADRRSLLLSLLREENREWWEVHEPEASAEQAIDGANGHGRR